MGPGTAARLLAGGLTLEELKVSDRLRGRLGRAIAYQWDQVVAWRELIRFDSSVPLT